MHDLRRNERLFVVVTVKQEEPDSAGEGDRQRLHSLPPMLSLRRHHVVALPLDQPTARFHIGADDSVVTIQD